jgi:hypothetical protein
MAHQGLVSITNASPRAGFHSVSRSFAPSRSSQPQFTNHRALLTNHITSNRSATRIETHVSMLHAGSAATHHRKINRQPRRLEFTVSLRKQTTDVPINRQLSGTSQMPLFCSSARRNSAHESYPRIVLAPASQVAIVFLKYA